MKYFWKGEDNDQFRSKEVKAIIKIPSKFSHATKLYWVVELHGQKSS